MWNVQPRTLAIAPLFNLKKSMEMAFQSMAMAFQSMAMAFQSMAMAFQSMAMAFQSMAMAFQSMAMAFQSSNRRELREDGLIFATMCNSLLTTTT